MFKNTAATGENSWTPFSGVFSPNFETLVDVSCDLMYFKFLLFLSTTGLNC
jgi:hypothetical protein